MPFASHRGQRIHYQVDGSGPVVLLQHGLLERGDRWREAGFVSALADAFRCVCVDSLGHGHSDKPTDASLYTREQRAGDLIAVLDALGAERAHVVGYSMGGWLASAVAVHHPDRLASLAIGGWDVVEGARGGAEWIREQTGQGFGFEALLDVARSTVPELAASITPQVEPALRACWDAMEELEGGADAVTSLGVPVLLWDGIDDPHHDPMARFAAANGLAFLSTPGDHEAARLDAGGEARKGLRAFLEAASRPSGG